MLIRFLLIGLFSTCLSLNSHSQQDSISRELKIQKAQGEIKVDGYLNEPAWQNAQIYSEFYIQQPVDGQLAKKVTEVQIVYTDLAIYVAAKCYDDEEHIINTLKRDNFMGSDAFCILLDPVNQKANGFGFGVNVFGAMTEVLIGEDGSDDSWDNKWKTETKEWSDAWTLEMEIPFKTLRYEAGKTEWGVNFARVDPGTNEVHVWSPVPRQFAFVDVGFYGRMVWDEAPVTQGKNISLIPYVTASANKIEADENGWTNKMNVGGDAKIALSTGLNLDLTFNPDFSQVEVDQQQTNLTQFNIFFPERRQFFIENADIFNNYGQFANQPFYSRRIGLDPSGRAVPILYGARLTGNINKKLRIGAFNIHSQGDGETSDGQNFSSLTLQHAIGKRSNVKALFLNRQGFDGSERLEGNFGRNLGGELNLIAEDGKLAGQIGYIHSLKDGVSKNDQHIYGRFDYNGQNFRTFLFVQNLGKDYYADMGFNARINNYNPETGEIVRIGYTQIGNMLDYYIYPDKENGKVNYHWSGIENFIVVNEGAFLNDWYTRFRHFIFFQNTSQLRFRLNHQFQHLVFPFAITEVPVPANKYTRWEYNVQFNTDLRKPFYVNGFIVYGDFYEGNKLTYRGSINFRKQPWGFFAVGLEQNNIRMPQPYGDIDITLASAQLEINLSTSLFWTSFVQYNTQANNFNINSRLQWRYAPMSDIFFVYTDNYLIEDMFGPKNKSLVLKVNYWLGI